MIEERKTSTMPNMSLKKNIMPTQLPEVRNKNFNEVALGYTTDQAVDEAKRCLNCKNRPCVGGCPVRIRIPDFIQLSPLIPLSGVKRLRNDEKRRIQHIIIL